MSWQRSFWFGIRVPFTKQLKRVKAGHGEVTINNADSVYIYINSIYFMTLPRLGLCRVYEVILRM